MEKVANRFDLANSASDCRALVGHLSGGDKSALQRSNRVAVSTWRSPDFACFSLTPGTISVILKSLRGVVPAVLSILGPYLWMAPWRSPLQQAKRLLNVDSVQFGQ